MRKIARRSLLLWAIVAALLAGVGFFCIQYAMHADEWVVFSGSPHVYASGNLNTGTVTDRDGTLLLTQTEAGRAYADDATLRQATLHLLGDRDGYIPGTALAEYASEMIGFDALSGLAGAEQGTGVMTLTVSAAAQKAAYAALNGRAGCVGVYNYETGEILCAVSGPSYDPDNVPNIADDTTGAYTGVYVNRLFQATYVPGSIFKLITAAAGLETLEGAATRTFTCNGSVEISGQVITCDGVHGTLDLKTALAKSCNCAFGQLAAELGGDVLARYVEAAGMLESYQFDGIATARGSFDVTQATAPDLAWAGIGQYTDLVNPCAYMVFSGAIAGGGQSAKPYLVREIRSGEGRITYTAEIEKIAPVMAPETAAMLGAWMRNNVQTVYGDGNFGGLSVCAKSGTAEVGGNATPHATFTGFVQDADYPLAFIVIVENAGSGSGVCASIAGSVLSACAAAMDAEA